MTPPPDEDFVEIPTSHDEPGPVFTDLHAAQIKPPQWVIEDFLPVGLTFLAAPPKSGKSSVTMAAACLVAGFQCEVVPPWMRRVNPGPVQIFSAEAEAGELKDMVVNGMGVSLKPGCIFIADNPWDFRLDDPKPGGWHQMRDWLDTYKPKLVIIDPLRDFHGLDENDAGDINRLLRPIRQWAMGNEASCVIVHHTKKPGEGHQVYKASDMRGTSALFGIADGVLMFTPIEGKSNAVTIEATFKRARGWKRKVQLSIYEDMEKEACEILSETESQLEFGLRGKGWQTIDEVGEWFRKDQPKIREALWLLKRNGMVLHDNGKWSSKHG